MLAATWVTAIATGLLAIFAIVTAIFAIKAFGKQSEEVGAIQKQVHDQETLTSQQAELLKVQSGQLELQRQQLDEQRAINAKQIEVLELQARELSESLDERKREMDGRRRAQATRVFIREERLDRDPRVTQAQAAASGSAAGPVIVAHLRNASDWPIYDVMLSWHRGSAPWEQPDLFPALMPGEEESATRALPTDLPDYVDAAVFGAVAFFRDIDRVMWRAQPDGVLGEIPPGQEPPHSW
jgi:hypothetical protein